MSSHSLKNPKMCKSPSKTMAAVQKADIHKSTKPISELGSYETLNTNCTMVGSNNLNLDSKMNYIAPQIKVCTKPVKSNAEIVKKPHSPRSMETFIHNSVIPNAKFQSSNNFNHVRPQAAIAGANFTKGAFENAINIPQGRLPVNKSPVPSFTSLPSASNIQPNVNMNNGGNMCQMSPSAYSNPSPNYPGSAVSPYNVQISSPANSISSISSGVAGIKSPVASPQNIRPPTPQPMLPQVNILSYSYLQAGILKYP